MHIWTLDRWKDNIDLNEKLCRDGLRVRVEKGVDKEVRRSCIEFTRWLRKEYCFPIRVVIYIKKAPYIKAMDGDYVVGTFFRPFDYYTEPYIRVATGDYKDLCCKWGKESALTAILLTIAHELTHYFQWINNILLTSIGEERQATRYSRIILDEYAETRDYP